MPLVKPKGRSKAAKNAAIGANIRVLKNENKSLSPGKKRSDAQIKAIAINVVSKGKKKK